MDFDLANYLLTRSTKDKAAAAPASSPRKEAYRTALTNLVMPNGPRILAFRSRPPSTSGASALFGAPSAASSSSRVRTGEAGSPAKPPGSRRLRAIRRKPDRTLDAPGLLDDYYRNLLDWGPANVLSIALGHTVHLMDANTGVVSELLTVDQDDGPVTSICWAPDGRHLAIALDSSDVQLWDAVSSRLLRTLRGMHPSRVSSLAWNDHTLSTGAADGSIVNNDVRSRSHVMQTYRGHGEEVCGLKWSTSGRQLASGGNDCLVHIWDLSMASISSPPDQNQWLHRFADHAAGVKALAWCPFQSNLLASGGGATDCSIKFWSTATGARLNSLDTGSQVCSLLWSKNTNELLSSHGSSARNQLTLWSYPSLAKVADFTGHTTRPLFTAMSPDGWTVASAAGGGDETLRLWHTFGTPKPKKPAAAAKHSAPFANCPYAHIRAGGSNKERVQPPKHHLPQLVFEDLEVLKVGNRAPSASTPSSPDRNQVQVVPTTSNCRFQAETN